MSAFRVGQKVICAPRDGQGPDWYIVVPTVSHTLPERGNVYVVRRIMGALIWLEGIENPPDRGREPGFWCGHFKPVAFPPQSLEHDVAEFKRIARHIPAPSKESVE